MEFDQDLRSIQEVRDLLAQAKQAQRALAVMTQEQLDAITAAISRSGAQHARRLADMAVEETGFGRKEDKEIKNRFAAVTLYEAIRDQKTHGILAEDREHRTVDIGVPVGVVAGLVPSTNPTSTVIYKAMICMKAGNPIVFSPHPGAANCIQETVNVIRRAAEEAGAPAGAISCITTPTIEATNALMRHDTTRLILATGGAAMVKAAYSSGTPAIGVGAGNGPAYIQRTADVPKAVAAIVKSKTFDNGTVCASEQSVIVEQSMEQTVRAEMQRQGCHFLDKQQADRLAGFLFRPNGAINAAVVGKTAAEIAQLAGLSGVPSTAKILVADAKEAGHDQPYSREKLCPILGFFVERDEDAVLEKCCQILRNEGSGHTFSMHTKDEAVVRRFGEKIPVSRFLVNTAATFGGIGASTNLFPALTLGCGAVGGSSSSNNIGPLDLINIRRIAWGVSDGVPRSSGSTTATPVSSAAAVTDDMVEALVNKILAKLQ